MESTILIVEDEIKIADTLKSGLIEQGYTAEVAYDGETGLQMFESNKYDIIVLDLNLPGISGYDLCKIIRSSNSQIPVIMLTALSSLEDKIEGYDAGADDYIIKPFEFKELLMKIRVLLKRLASPKFSGDSILQAGDLQMNLDSKIVTRGGAQINLTVKEFQLLEYLLRNKNRIVSRSDIAIHVWEIDFFTNTNVIDVYINYLRNKIDKSFPDKLIQTQPGMGYVLKDKP
jgi:two-component system, OmpR family, copper resistance phosphate regulon response regulator CusR